MTVEVEIESGVFLDCYQPLRNNGADINLLWGGRDSGKSQFIAQHLIELCLGPEYFRCILVKETYESIKDAQWQTIKEIIEDWGLTDLFSFKQSPLEIKCVNGNKFIARGCDKPEKLKSIRNPSHVWIEEGNQLKQEDYIILSTTLRSSSGRVQEWISFNPECDGDSENFWMTKQWPLLKSYNSGTSTVTTTLNDKAKTVVDLTYTSTHTTYHDNKFCTPERRAKLEGLFDINPYYHDVFTLGLWGKHEVKRPFAYNFKKSKHVLPTAIYQEGRQVYISIDFNVEPLVALCFHYWHDSKGEHLHCFKEVIIENNGSVPELCERLKGTFGPAMHHAIFTGDAMQRKREITQKNNIDAWKIIDGYFHLGLHRLKVPRANPLVEDTRHLINIIFAIHTDMQIHPDCKGLIYELQFSEVDEDGAPIKKSRDNIKQRYDKLDAFRYMCNTFLRYWLDRGEIK